VLDSTFQQQERSTDLHPRNERRQEKLRQPTTFKRNDQTEQSICKNARRIVFAELGGASRHGLVWIFASGEVAIERQRESNAQVSKTRSALRTGLVGAVLTSRYRVIEELQISVTYYDCLP
jgi:hypothetical protein